MFIDPQEMGSCCIFDSCGNLGQADWLALHAFYSPYLYLDMVSQARHVHMQNILLRILCKSTFENLSKMKVLSSKDQKQQLKRIYTRCFDFSCHRNFLPMVGIYLPKNIIFLIPCTNFLSKNTQKIIPCDRNCFPVTATTTKLVNANVLL